MNGIKRKNRHSGASPKTCSLFFWDLEHAQPSTFSSFFDINKIKEFGHIVITEAFSVFFIANGLVGIVFGHYYGFFVTPGPIVSRIISSIITALSIFYFYNYHADKYKEFLFKSAIPLVLISLALEQIGRLTIL